jgi:glutathione S-transferase
MITLYLNWNAVCAQKVMLCLAEKGIPAEIQHIDLAKLEQLEPAYLALNPNGVVPTLVDDDFVVIESTVINEYLDDKFTQTKLRPESPRGRAELRMWGKVVDDVVHVSIRPISFTRFVAERSKAMSADERASMRARTPKKELAELWTRVAEAPYTEAELAYYLHKIEAVLDRMESTLAHRPWLAGDRYSLADLNITPYFRRLEQLEKVRLWEEGRPRVNEWLSRIKGRPSYRIFDDLKARFAA